MPRAEKLVILSLAFLPRPPLAPASSGVAAFGINPEQDLIPLRSDNIVRPLRLRLNRTSDALRSERSDAAEARAARLGGNNLPWHQQRAVDSRVCGTDEQVKAD